jgi:hypothetical protein
VTGDKKRRKSPCKTGLSQRLWTLDFGLWTPLKNVQKKIKKNVDARLVFWQIALTHGTQHQWTAKAKN